MLKDHLIEGYTINKKRLEQLEKTVEIIKIANRIENDLESSQAKVILNVLEYYSRGLELLDKYDHKRIKKPIGINSKTKINYIECLNVINQLKYNEESEIFALERDEGLKGIIGNIYQTFDKKDVYPTVEEKASNLLYLIV